MSNSNILLVDVDSQIPNLALMKISAHHRARGDEITVKKLGISYFPTRKKQIQTVYVDGYDEVYVSAIFPESSKSFCLTLEHPRIPADGTYLDTEGKMPRVYKGGTGFDLQTKLPEKIECMRPDYSIYPEGNTSYGFLTRGCSRRCSFCIVYEKEGHIRLDTALEDIVQHKQVKFLDNNILMHPEHMNLLAQIKNAGIRCQFNQGLDIRCITDENAKALSELRYLGNYIFAFDWLSEEAKVAKGLSIFKKYVSEPWRTKFFVYCHPDMDIAADVVYRCEWLRKHEALPYVMRDISCWASENSDFYIDFCAYTNQPNLFKKMSFAEYIAKRQPKNVARREKSLSLYQGSEG